MISVIIPVFNADQYINRCIESCLKQSCSDIEIVAVNDGSCDNSGDILDKIAQSDSRVKVFHTPNHGVTMARKTAVAKTSGEWLFFLDSDDYIPHYSLEKLLAKATKTDADMVIGEFNYCNPDASIIKTQTNKIRQNALSSALRFECTGNLCGRIVKRDIFNQIELPSSNIKIGEDMVCGLQLLQLCNSVELLEEPVYNYIQYPNSTINSKNPQKVASMIPYFEWIDNYFKNATQKIRKEVDFFLLNEYFAYLRYGGTFNGWQGATAVFKRATKEQKLPKKINLAFCPIGQPLIKILNKIK